MRQEEFLTSFQEALTGNVPDRIIQENIVYYKNYINKQMQTGKSEEDILGSLGNPRLLAKTIIDTNNFAVENEQTDQDSWRQEFHDRYRWRDQEEENTETKSEKGIRTLQIPNWLAGILCVVVMALLIGLAFCVVSYLAPIILVVGIVVLGYRVIRKAFKGY